MFFFVNQDELFTFEVAGDEEERGSSHADEGKLRLEAAHLGERTYDRRGNPLLQVAQQWKKSETETYLEDKCGVAKRAILWRQITKPRQWSNR